MRNSAKSARRQSKRTCSSTCNTVSVAFSADSKIKWKETNFIVLFNKWLIERSNKRQYDSENLNILRVEMCCHTKS